MLFRTHLVTGIVLGLLFLRYTDYLEAQAASILLFFLIVLVASLLPDIDSPSSAVGRRAWGLSWIVRLFAGHRKFFHAVWIPLAALFVFIRFEAVAFGMLVGYCSHLLADSLTVEGIRPFYPARFRLRGFVETGGFGEGLYFVAWTALGFFLCWQMFFS
jgi:inner membrane protein